MPVVSTAVYVRVCLGVIQPEYWLNGGLGHARLTTKLSLEGQEIIQGGLDHFVSDFR